MSSPLAQTLRLLPALIALMFAVAPAHTRAETAPPNAKPDTAITINVFGAVEKPGAYPLTKNSTLLDALGAAGGWRRTANAKKIALIRGPAGEKPAVVHHDAEAILHGDQPNPKLEDHDSIFVPEQIF